MKPVGQGLFNLRTVAFDRPLAFGKNFGDPNADARPVIRGNESFEQLFANRFARFRYGLDRCDADVVITCLPTSPDVESLLDGDAGLLRGMRSGTTLVDCTSGDPTTSQRMARRLAAEGRDAILAAPDEVGIEADH